MKMLSIFGVELEEGCCGLVLMEDVLEGCELGVCGGLSGDEVGVGGEMDGRVKEDAASEGEGQEEDVG